MSLYAPLLLSWMTLPMILVVLVGFVSRDSLQGWAVAIWLAAAVALHFLGKWLIAARLMSFADPLRATVILATVGVGTWWMWFYWRRREEPSLLATYARFALLDGLVTLFVLLPRILWAG